MMSAEYVEVDLQETGEVDEADWKEANVRVRVRVRVRTLLKVSAFESRMVLV